MKRLREFLVCEKERQKRTERSIGTGHTAWLNKAYIIFINILSNFYIMKKEIAALELHFIIQELSFLSDAKLDGIFQPDKKDMILQFHKTGVGKAMIRINAGKFMYLTSYKQPSPLNPFSFCMKLRKTILNSRLRSISQVGFERIVEFVFETKEEKFSLFIELFGKGNAILCKNEIIEAVMESHKFADRTVSVNRKYEYPKLDYNLLEISEKELEEFFRKSKEESIVKALAVGLGLGGVYAEELCLRSKVDKSLKPMELSLGNVELLFDEIKKLRKASVKPTIIFKNDAVKDITPLELSYYYDFEFETRKSYNEAFDEFLTVELKGKEEEKLGAAKNKELVKVETIIEKQSRMLEEVKKSVEENQKKGEAIYENYKMIEEILKEINKAREKYSWKEIKEKLKGHDIIKDINEKESVVMIEVK